ncbi:11725_t:CDS:2, partial [Entrophospora sp. SA101]
AEEKGKKKRKSKNPVVDESSNNNNNNDENANTLINRNNWKLQSGITVKRLLKEATNLSGHVMRLENWGVIRCGLNISRPKWCAEADYNEIQQIYDLIYKPGEIALSSIESYRKRKKESDYEQKSDGVFLMCLKNHYIEIGHVEISGGYGCIDKPRSTWDHLKGAVGNIYMLGDLSYCYKKASYRTFSKIQVSFLHGLDNHLELWRMSNPASGVLIFERTHKVVVPIDWDNQQIYFFNFIKLLWDLKLCLLDTIESIKKLHEENLANMFEENYRPLHGRLPMHSLTPCKEQHRAGINAICVESEDE